MSTQHQTTQHSAAQCANRRSPTPSPTPSPKRPIAVSGDRPTGALHLGHYAGSLATRLQLQETHEQYLLIADLQALTDNAEAPRQIAANVVEVALDYLAIGLDPARSTFCVQSHTPELAELTMYLLNLVSIGRLQRNPTVKSEIGQRRFKGGIPAGFLMYPVNQAADITAFRASVAAVGEDQLPVIEQTNEIVRSLNRICDYALLPEVTARIGRAARLPGPDGGSKMSKSLGNVLRLSATGDDIQQFVNRMYTDPTHLRAEDPGKTEGNVVFTYLDAFAPDTLDVEALRQHYRRGGLGDVKLKQQLVAILDALLAPIRIRRAHFANDRGEVLRLLRVGTDRARGPAALTLSVLRRALGFNYFT